MSARSAAGTTIVTAARFDVPTRIELVGEEVQFDYASTHRGAAVPFNENLGHAIQTIDKAIVGVVDLVHVRHTHRTDCR